MSNRLISSGPDATGWRLPAAAFEAAVTSTIANHLSGCAERLTLLAAADVHAARTTADAVADLVRKIKRHGIVAARPLIAEGRIERGQLRIELDRDTLAGGLGCSPDDLAEAALLAEAPFGIRRRGVEMKIVAGERERTPDPTLLRALRHAQGWGEAIRAGTPLSQLARSENVSERYLARILPLAGLSPNLLGQIIDGIQPVEMTLAQLLRTPLPLDWGAHERLFDITG